MPRMSDTMEEGNIVAWNKQEGEAVEAGETLAEIETDKATMDFDSPMDGILFHIAVKEGPVPIGEIIAVIGEEGEDWEAELKAAQSGASAPESPAEPTAQAEPATAVAVVSQPAGSTGNGERIKASPLAKSMAKESGIDLSQIQGSGDHGRIIKRDIEAFLKTDKPKPQQQKAAAIPPPPSAQPVSLNPLLSGEASEDVPLSQMRKAIARNLSASKFTAPHFYLTIELDMDKVIQMRKRVNEVATTRVSFNDFVIKAAAAALREHPAINSSWNESSIRINKQINVGVAVAIDEGLLVPVINAADIKTLSQINLEVRDFAGRAKERKLQPHEMQGSTFTISNLGMFGIEEFTAIINPPNACIMAVGAIISKPVVKDGEIAVGNRMKVTLSCDHRVVDGATGAQFLQTFKEILENPVRLLV